MSSNEEIMALNIFNTSLKSSIENLNNTIYTFAAATSKINENKNEMEKLARDVARLKLDVGSTLLELQRLMQNFPVIANESIRSSIGATSSQLTTVYNTMIAGFEEAITEVFKAEKSSINDATKKVRECANEIVTAKKYYGWESIAINFVTSMFGAMLAALLVMQKVG